MALGNDLTNQDALLKEVYSEEAVESAIYTDNPFLAMVPKETDVSGRHRNHDVVYGAGGGRSATFSNAQTLSTKAGVLAKQFLVAPVTNTGVATVSADLISESGDDAGSFLRVTTEIIDAGLQEFANDFAVNLFRGSDGARGQISSDTTLASSTLKLRNAKDAANFSVGMELDLCATQTGSTVKAKGSAAHGLYVVGVDRTAGTLTIGSTSPVPGNTPGNINDSTTGVPTAAALDFIYCVGDYDLKMAGVESWIPYGGASSASFFGVDRTVDQVRLGGNYLDATSLAIDSAIEDAIAQVSEQGGKLDNIFCSPKKFAELSKLLGSKGQYQMLDLKAGSAAQVGFQAIKVAGNGGVVQVVSDRSVPADRMFGVKMSSWRLLSWGGKAPRIWTEPSQDNRIWNRMPSDMGCEVRFYSRANLVCKSPRDNITIKVLA